MERQLTQSIAEHLEEFGLRLLEPTELAEIPMEQTVPVTLSHSRGAERFRAAFTTKMTLASLAWAQPRAFDKRRLLVLGPRVTERSAEMFRRLGINYIDSAGNAYLTFDGVHIDVRGRRAHAPAGELRSGANRGGVNLFSTKRSQVIFALLTWPELLERPVRELSNAAGASLGQTQETLGLLAHYGFLDERKRLIPAHKERLIDQWVAAFPTGLGSEARTKPFSGDWQSLDLLETQVFVSGEAAVPEFLRAETAVLYTDDSAIELIRAGRWRRNNAQPNILLRRQFWEAPKTADLTNTAPGRGTSAAPWLLIYADLLASHDSRQREAAAQLRALQQ